MEPVLFFFWLSWLTLLYIYIGYPALAWVLSRAFGREPKRGDALPSVTLYIPAYNEERHIGGKLENSLGLDYPRDRLEIVVASDGSTDRTNAIVESYRGRGVQLLLVRDNIGKLAVLNRFVPLVQGDVVVFSDASTELEPNALRLLVRSFADKRVGAVCGLYRLKRGDDMRGQGEGLYWRYETWLKRQESRLHSILGAHGAFYAIRKPLFQRLDTSLINDDYLIPMRVVAQGYRAVYDASARAWELEESSVAGEFARRRRIAVGNCQQVTALAPLLNPLRGWVAFSFFSHKVLRTVAPLFLVALFVASWWLPLPWAIAMTVLQITFYAAAVVGYRYQQRGVSVRWLSAPLYFCLGNLAMLAGLATFCTGARRPAWSRPR